MTNLLHELRSEENRLIEQLKTVRKLIEVYEPRTVNTAHGSETEFSKMVKNINLEVDESIFFPCDKSELNLLRSKVLNVLARYSSGKKYKSNRTEGGFNITRKI